MKLADGTSFALADLPNIAAFVATPWRATPHGASNGSIIIDANAIRSANLIAIPVDRSDRLILVGRCDWRWVVGMGPWRMEHGEIVRGAGRFRAGLRELYLSYLETSAWLSDYL